MVGRSVVNGGYQPPLQTRLLLSLQWPITVAAG